MTTMGRKYCRWSMCCSPEPIAKLMRVFPKLALVFLVLHVTMMIYSVTKPFPGSVKPEKESPPGVVDEPEPTIFHIRQGMKNLTSSLNNTRIKGLGNLVDGGEKHKNKTRLGLLDKLNKLRNLPKLQQAPRVH